MTNIADMERVGTIDFTRQRDWFDPTQNEHLSVTLVGAGGVGSVTALALNKLGIPKLTLIDGDTVEKHNLPNQMFPLDSIGQPKVHAMADVLAQYGVSDVTPIYGYLGKDGVTPADSEDPDALSWERFKPRGIVVSGLDSMAARETVWEAIKSNRMRVPVYFDARLGGENIVLYTVNPLDPDSVNAYEATLHSDDEASEAPCTRRSIIDVGFAVSSLITRAVRRHIAGEDPERLVFWNHAGLRATVPA